MFEPGALAEGVSGSASYATLRHVPSYPRLSGISRMFVS